MTEDRRMGVIGVAIQPNVTDATRSLEELLFDVARAALADATLDIEAIDGIVVAGNDQYDGRAISVMAASGSVGGVDRDILSTPSAGEHAFILGALRVATGQFHTQLVASWSPTAASSLAEVQRLAADPYFHRALPLDELASHALQATALGAQVAGLDDAAWSVVHKNRRHGASAYPASAAARSRSVPGRMLRWPLSEGMTAAPTTGAVGLVLASGAYIAAHGIADVAWIDGMGWATEPSFLGDRQLAHVPGLEAAVKQAYGAAQIDAPFAAFDVAEICDTTPYQELLACEALGLAPRATWARHAADGTFAAGGKLPVNLSGGAQTFNPVYCTGMMRIAELANQIRGRAGRHQNPQARRGVACAASGFAMQYGTVVVFGRGEERTLP